jgi:hypothetical protein
MPLSPDVGISPGSAVPRSQTAPTWRRHVRNIKSSLPLIPPPGARGRPRSGKCSESPEQCRPKPTPKPPKSKNRTPTRKSTSKARKIRDPNLMQNSRPQVPTFAVSAEQTKPKSLLLAFLRSVATTPSPQGPHLQSAKVSAFRRSTLMSRSPSVASLGTWQVASG